ncbi:membrane protease subunit, partial [Streptomyces sp. AC154]
MRSTVPDSSGNQENGAPDKRGYGEERYGALPVREWAAPERAPGPGGPYDWSVPEPGERGAGPVARSGPVVRSGPDSVVDLVLDLTPGAGEPGGSAFGATSASVSVPGTAPAADAAVDPLARADAEEREGAGDPGQPALAAGPFLPGPGLAPARRDLGPSLSLSFGDGDASEIRTGTRTELRTEVRVDTGRHHSVIANERTASIPVHLLFRDDPEVASDAVALPATVVRGAAGSERPAGVRRPPLPRSPQVRPSTRPAPVADPRLKERPGPALPGWAALLAALGSLAAAGGVLWWA